MTLVIDNDGPEIAASNYWTGGFPGQYFLSTNAGVFRLLLSRAAEGWLPDLRTAVGAAISRGPWPAGRRADALEILFDDGSDDPFALHTSIDAVDRVPPDSESGRRCLLTVWVAGPRKVLELPCLYRRVPRIPWLRPWEELP